MERKVNMRRLIAAGLLTIALPGCMEAGAGFGSSGPSIAMEIDKNYRPRVGDRASLFGVDRFSNFERVPLLIDVTALDKFERISQTKDVAELAGLEERGELVWTPAGTRVALLKVADKSSGGPRVAAEVRVVDGTFRDRPYWTPLEYVVKYRAVTPEPQ